MNQTRYKIEELILSKGYVLAEELNSPASFGSWYIEWVKGHMHLRLVWDGKESYIKLEKKVLSDSRDVKNWQEQVGYLVKSEKDWLIVEERISAYIQGKNNQLSTSEVDSKRLGWERE